MSQKRQQWNRRLGALLTFVGAVFLLLSGRESWTKMSNSHAQTSKPTQRFVGPTPPRSATTAPAKHKVPHAAAHGHGQQTTKALAISPKQQQAWVKRNLTYFRNPLPGMSAHPIALAQKMAQFYLKKGKGYHPHTRHVLPNHMPKYTNRLIFETSPYLLQHAHNPLNWYPWGNEAFERAKKENKPVFLSVGYSTCHWCHVMEKQSFENPIIAAYMNKHYIAIKVDREERLDVDGIYMKAVQIFSRGGGGWPMSVWLTPSRRPFFGGTYFPPGTKWGRRGFLTVLKDLYSRFKKNPMKIANRSYWAAQRIRSMTYAPPAAGVPRPHILAQTNLIYRNRFDPVNGGRRGRPKFPSSFGNSFLLRYFRRAKDKRALQMVVTTLEKMAHGGIYDQVGGGFHRYSVDARWLVPHFEKMLYDNALLSALYTEAYQASKNPLFARISKEILDYVIKEMTSPEGAFYSATDADSEGHEGKFFVWTKYEIQKILGKKLARQVGLYWGVTSGGNFEGKTILNVPRPMPQVARTLGIKTQELRQAVKKAKKLLYAVRKKRIPPLLDTKIITSWNGLMISAFARAGLAFQQPKYTKQAIKAASFLLSKMRKNGRLFRTYKDGRARHNSYLEDYAFLTAGLLDLFEATQNPRWFKAAISLQTTLQKHYWDKANGGYFRTSNDHESLIIRPKPNYDGAVPTGNSIQSMNLMRLFTWTTQDKYLKYAEKTFKYFGRRISRWPVALSEMLLAIEYYYDAPKEIILIKPNATASIQPFLNKLRQQFLPNRVLIVATEGKEQKRLEKLFPLLHKKKSRNGKVTAYVCMKRVCELPTTNTTIFAQQLAKVTKIP